MEHLQFTHATNATSEEIADNNTDIDGKILLHIGGTQILGAGEVFFYFGDTTAGNEVLEISPGGVYIDGTFGYSSDFSLKENFTEISSKKWYEIIIYVKPKTFYFTHLNKEKNRVNHLGHVAQRMGGGYNNRQQRT